MENLVRSSWRTINNLETNAFIESFSLCLIFAFDYWETNKAEFISDSELKILNAFSRSLIEYAGAKNAIDTFTQVFADRLAAKRMDRIAAIEKSFEAFRKEVLIKSGFYSVVYSTNGIKKEADSISFANMDDTKFAEVYKAVFFYLLEYDLSEVFRQRRTGGKIN